MSWNSAVLIDADTSTTAVELIEFALVELLLLRAYDADLDARLPGMYERIGRAGRRFAVPLLRHYRGPLIDAQRQLAEVTEITERLDNALKNTDDVYWDRLYSALLKVMRVEVWRNGVKHKLDLLRETYSMLRERAEAERSLTLEVAVVLLIFVEIILAIVHPTG